MILYSFFNSSTSYRVRIALALKGITPQMHTINIRTGAQYTLEHRQRSPVGAVPVLVDDAGNTLSQSLAILDYLDHLQPDPPLFPDDALHKARVQELCQVIGCDIHPVNNLRVLKYLSTTLQVDDAQRKAWYAHWIAEGMTAVESLLQRAAGEGPYCFGQAPGAADCCLIPQMANARRMGCDLSAYPRAEAVFAHCQQHPAFQAAAPEQQPDYVAP